jgi:hypothetical protein
MHRIMLIFGLLWLWVLSVHAQSMPIIESFTVDKPLLDYPAVERGIETADFSWRAVGLREGDRMQMHAWVGGQWGLIGENFEPEKTDTLVIAHPLDFILPKYRLSVVDSSGAIVAQAFLELPYAPQTELPTIAMFLTINSAGAITMSQFDEPFQVQWRVENRWFHSNLVFEQILPDGTVLNAEIERPAWQYAHKADYVQLVYPGDYADVVLRLRVVNLDDGSTLVQQDLILPIMDSPVTPAEVITFSVTPEIIKPGDTVTVTWEVANTDAVFIEYHWGYIAGYCAGNLKTVYQDLPLSGSLEIISRAAVISDLQFRLYADYYVGGDRHHCGSLAEPLAEATVGFTDYIGQGVESFIVEEGHFAVVGDTVTLSWEVSEGNSVTIVHSKTDNSVPPYHEMPSAYETYSDLPLSGTLEVTIVDNPFARAASGRYFLLYIIEDDTFPPNPDWSTDVILDRDGNLDCDTLLNVGENDLSGPEAGVPGMQMAVQWDSCGNENTLLRLALVQGDYDTPPVSEEFVAVEPSGTMTITLPDELGTYYIQLYYEYEGEPYSLRSSPVIIEEAQG